MQLDEDIDELPASEKQLPIIKLYIFFLFMFQSSFRISDAALDALLLFLSMFLSLVSSNCDSKSLKNIVTEMPHNIKAARKYVSRNASEFKQYACCPKCFNILYERGKPEVNECPYIKFPNHPQIQHRQSCNTLLTKTIKTPSQKIV